MHQLVSPAAPIFILASPSPRPFRPPQKLLFPFTSRNFVRILAAEAGLTSGGMQQGLGGPLGGMGGDVAGPAMAGVSPYAAPVHDENAPDLYIPLMAFITFVLMSGLLSGE